MSEFLKSVKNSIKHWYILLIVGILFIGMGVYAFSKPIEVYLSLALFFGYILILSGILEIIFSISNRKEIDNWGWTLIFGLMTLIAGILLVGNPGITMVTLSLILGFTLLFRSITAISYSIDLKQFGVSDWGYLLFLGILGVVFSLFVLWYPLAGGEVVTLWIGISLIISGVYSIYVSLKLRKLKRMSDKVADKLKS